MSEPRTEAGRRLLDAMASDPCDCAAHDYGVDSILAIEAEAIILGSEKTWNLTAARADAGELARLREGSLDAAWAAAEAALPEGWRIYGVQYTGDEPWSLPVWRAWAGLAPYGNDENPYAASIGPTPVAALLALAAALRERDV